MADSSASLARPLASWERVFLTVLCFAVFMPVAFQSIATGFLLIWFIASKAWQDWSWLSTASRSQLKKREPVIYTLAVAVGISASLVFVAMLAESWVHDRSIALQAYLRLIGKQGLYGLFVIAAFRVAYLRGWRLEQSLNSLLVLIGVLSVYVIIQRYTGIDWVYGFSARIPEHRYSYGVYRAAGFLSHPLLFAHNVMLFAVLAFGLAMRTLDFDRSQAIKWMICSILAVICIICSGSRFPLFVTLFLIAATGLRSLAKSRKFWLAATLLVVALFSFERATIDRYLEVFANSELSWEEREPRLIFWKVHWAMFQDHPIVGLGYNTRREHRAEYYEREGYGQIERQYSAHNIYLQSMADSGLLGLAALSSLLIGIAWAAGFVWRRTAMSGLALVALATVLTGLLQNNLRDSTFLFSLWMCFAMVLVSRYQAQKRSSEGEKK